MMCQHRHEREPTKQRRCRAQNRQVGSLPLRFDAERLTDFMLCDLHLPTLNEPFDNLYGRRIQIGAEQRLRFKFAQGVTYDHPANWQGRLSAVKPHGRLAREFDSALDFAIPNQTAGGLRASLGSSKRFWDGQRP